MKKYIYAMVVLMAGLFASCSNDDITIEGGEAPKAKGSVSINISLNNFYQSYDFKDTKHSIDISEQYRTFQSESKKYIQVRTLIYDKSTGNLQDSIVKYVTTTNSVLFQKELPVGNYYALTTLAFADKEDSNSTYWALTNKENIRTAKMKMLRSQSIWSVISESSEEFIVESKKQANVVSTPAPMGSLCYIFMQNFQFKDEATFLNTGAISDNGIRSLALYTQQKSIEFNLDPNAISRYNFLEDAGKNSWYYLSNMEPNNFDKGWTFFESNLYGYCYVLAPKFSLCFGYELEDQSGFTKHGEATYTNQNGKVYLAYWDWFQVGNPYFGIADNNHWHTYNYAKSGSRAASDAAVMSRQNNFSFSPDYMAN